MSDLRDAVLHEGYWFADGTYDIDTPLTDALVALYEATEYRPDLSFAEAGQLGLAARKRITELLEGGGK